MNLSRRCRPLAALAFSTALVTSLAGCAGYSQQTAEVVSASKAGNVDLALSNLESKNSGSDKDLLYYLEKGELLRQKGSYEGSRDTWLAADDKVRQWEETAKTDPSKLLGDLGSVLLNDTTRRYDGRDYEKVFLSVRLAEDHLAVGDWDKARIEIKKMHEREAIIADFRAKELDEAEKKAQEKGIKTRSFKQLNGYPIETLEDPAVRALKNAYESAFANYLAGFVYETLGEGSLAAPGYRKAAEMRPNVPLLDDSLKSLDTRLSNRTKNGMVDTLLVLETGTAPTIQSVTIPIILPIPSKHGLELLATPISWPVIRPDPTAFIPTSVLVDEQPQPAVLLTDVNVMARRALADEMPGIITRSSVRAITRGITQAALDHSAEEQKGNAALVTSLISLMVKVASVATEVADERIWRTLPGTYSVARVSLTPGSHKIGIATPGGLQVRDITVGGNYAMIAVRMQGGTLALAQSPVKDVAADAVVTPATPEIKPQTPPPAVAEKKAKPAKKPAQTKAPAQAKPAAAAAAPAATPVAAAAPAPAPAPAPASTQQ